MQELMNKDVLNLDEVLGENKLKVRYQGKEYLIRSVKSLSPQEVGQVMRYGQVFNGMDEEQLQVNNGEVVLRAIDDLLEIIAPSLPRYKPSWKEYFSKGYKRRFVLSLQEAVAVMEFWSNNNRAKNAVGAVSR